MLWMQLVDGGVFALAFTNQQLNTNKKVLKQIVKLYKIGLVLVHKNSLLHSESCLPEV